MSVLAWKNRTRITVLGLLIVVLAAATVVVGGRQSAQAFDCNGVDPKPTACPFLEIEQQDMPYIAKADLLSPSGSVLYSWTEGGNETGIKGKKKGAKGPTLWHWRWHGGPDRVHLTVTPKDENVKAKEFNFPAGESHCYLVDPAGVFEIDVDCNDNEDSAK